MQTIRDFLISTFGETANEIEGIDNQWIGGWTFKTARFTFCGNEGRLQVKCSGDCLITFTHDNNVRGCVYLVYDDNEGQNWDAQARQGVPWQERKPTHYRPHARLRLVSCA